MSGREVDANTTELALAIVDALGVGHEQGSRMAEAIVAAMEAHVGAALQEVRRDVGAMFGDRGLV
jgi:hypothetical protein